MRFMPIEPSAPVPDSTTHTARSPRASASVRKKMSIGARRSSTRVAGDWTSQPSSIVRLCRGETT